MNILQFGHGHMGRHWYRMLRELGHEVALVDPDPVFQGGSTVELTESVWDSSDAVLIATPPSTHFELVMESLNRGKHLLCEKPMTLSSGDAEEVLRKSREVEKTVWVNHTLLAYNGWAEALDFGGHFVRWNVSNRAKEDVMFDLALHDLAVIFTLFGDPQDFWCWGTHQESFVEVRCGSRTFTISVWNGAPVNRRGVHSRRSDQVSIDEEPIKVIWDRFIGEIESPTESSILLEVRLTRVISFLIDWRESSCLKSG